MKKILTLIFALIAMSSTSIADPDEHDYLFFRVEKGMTISIENNEGYNVEYYFSGDKSIGWTRFSERKVNENGYIYFRGVNPNGVSKLRFKVTHPYLYDETRVDGHWPVACGGNIMSLIDGKGETTIIPVDDCFVGLFSQCNLTSAPKLPATTLTKKCYTSMFYGCSFTEAPELPATILADSCYFGMFSGCTYLEVAPELPATVLTNNCYSKMFYGCTNLKIAPKLPATILTNNCYNNMFSGCTNLMIAPDLPATILAESCYSGMFSGCTKLTTAPELPAITLTNNCYKNMFNGCTNLATTPKLAATTMTKFCYAGMFSGCKKLTSASNLPATTLADSCYYSMFSNTSLTVAPGLPATTLAGGCYLEMFKNCTSLTATPDLPATTLASYCCMEMFTNCTSLATAPKLPATTLANGCYNSMFSGCTSMIVAPELPATNLSPGCYYEMFKNCTSLTTAPKLPATTLANSCYRGMFRGCSCLSKAPELPATTLEVCCYMEMFDSCTSLTAAPELPATTMVNGCYNYMFQKCTNLSYSPLLLATTLVERCYYHMFEDCEKLESVFCCVPPISSVNLSMALGGTPWSRVATKGKWYFIYSGGLCTSEGFLPSGWEIVYIGENKIKKLFSVVTTDENITIDKNEVRYNDIIHFTVKDRSNEGYIYKRVTVNDIDIHLNGFSGSLEMWDYMQDITIKVEYYKTIDFLYFDVKKDNIVKINKIGSVNPNIQYSFDTKEWNELTEDGVRVASDGRIYFKGYNPEGISKDANNFVSFSVENKYGTKMPFECGGNIMTLIDEMGQTFRVPNQYCFTRIFRSSLILTSPELPAITLTNHCYYDMFYGCTSLTTAPKLPATTLANSCYRGMFRGCSCLSKAPELPATTLEVCCYMEMFERCTSLTAAPELPATSLADYCYSSMFYGCTSLISVPELPATTLARHCYSYMFRGCTRLTQAPLLPTTTLADDCYNSMFGGCTGLTTAPELPASTLAIGCYSNMFNGCTGLTTAPELPATTLAISCYSNMFNGCTSLSQAPQLPATTMSEHCYEYMFSNCVNLTEAPELPATTVKSSYAYAGIFYKCSKIQYICVNFEQWERETDTDRPLRDWVKNVSETGTFVCPGNLEIKYGDSYIPDGWTIKRKNPITYIISCADANITADKTTATIEDNVNLTIKDRTSEGYKLDKVLVNSNEIAVQNYQASFDMKDYMKDITITAQYSKIPYTITTDEYSQVANTTANVDDAINVTFKQRDGYNLTSATYNGTALTVSNYKSSFTMPAANVEIKTVYSPITYVVSCTDANITTDKTTATIEDKVNLTIKDRTDEGYKLDKVLVNSTEIAVKNFKASFDMKDYLKDVTISAQYSKIPYTITTDEYSQVANTTATVDDAITVTFKQREGFDLTSATYNGNPLNIKDYKATFTMPAQDVEIKTVYTEKVYEIEKPSEGVSVSQPSAKAGDEITISVNPKDGYTVHLYVNGAEVALNGNSAVYTMPSGKIEITVKYVVEEKTPVSEIELDNCAVSVFPNPAKSGEEITLNVGGKFDMNNAKIYLYNASGSLVMQIDNVKEYNQLTLRSGVYVGVLVTKGGKKTFRVAVK